MPNLLRSLSLFNRPIRKNRQFMHQSRYGLSDDDAQYIENRLKKML